jgi:hypothetical protein
MDLTVVIPGNSGHVHKTWQQSAMCSRSASTLSGAHKRGAEFCESALQEDLAA